MPEDWHPEDIKAEIRKTGITLEALGKEHRVSAVRRALRCPWPKVEAIIARHLGLVPQIIWPSRYDNQGRPLRGLRRQTKTSRREAGRHRQKMEAA